VAVVTPRRQVKNAYLVFFFSSMLSVGLVIGAPVWPFHDWHLWARMLPRTVNYQEVWLEDSTGRQIVYDLRAVPPLNPAYLNKLIAPRIKMLGEQGEKNPMVEWLLKKANSYQPPAPWSEWIRFPEREYSHYQCAGLYENSRIFPEWPPPDENGFPSDNRHAPANPRARTPRPASLKISVDPPHREKYLPADPLDSSHDKSPPHIGFVVTLPSFETLRFRKKRQYAGLTPFSFFMSE
jgi:hypothetical protein